MAQPKVKGHRIHRPWCKGCGVCMQFCPKEVLELDEEGKACAARASECIGCKTCERMCPDLAIEIQLEEEENGSRD